MKVASPDAEYARGRIVYLLLPAYNEEEGLEKLLGRLERIATAYRLDLHILIVDDGSTDHTQIVIRSFLDVLSIEVEAFRANRGVAEVFSVGFRRVLESAHDHDYCITMDSDNTQNPYYILDLVTALDSGAEIAIASRFAPGGGMRKAPRLRALLSYGVAYLLRVFVGLPGIKDYSTFFRGYRVGLLRQVFARHGGAAIQGHGFACMARFLILAAEQATDIREVPLILRYDLKEGGSGMRIWRTIRGYLRILRDHGRWPPRGSSA
jgi:dolichol-phosphate mannosyltransferase